MNYAGDGEVITVTPGLNKIPVYVKDGGIIPMMKPMLHAPKAGEKVDLEIRHYGTNLQIRIICMMMMAKHSTMKKAHYSWRTINVVKSAVESCQAQ